MNTINNHTDSIEQSALILDEVKYSLGMSLQIGGRIGDFTMDTRLLASFRNWIDNGDD